MEQLLIDILNNLDMTSLSQLDWADISTYGILVATAFGGLYGLSKTIIGHIWNQVEKPLGFLISSLVVFSLWYAILRVHVSVSFNLDKEAFDNLLWLSAITFTPYYLAHYDLIEHTVMFFTRMVELILDLVIFSWFEDRAKANRIKWRNRLVQFRVNVVNYYYELFQVGAS